MAATLKLEIVTPESKTYSDDVEMVTTPWGGHAAFITGRWPWKPLYWAEQRAVEWLTKRPI